jgi:hypothetical protein
MCAVLRCAVARASSTRVKVRKQNTNAANCSVTVTYVDNAKGSQQADVGTLRAIKGVDRSVYHGARYQVVECVGFRSCGDRPSVT